MSTVIQADNVKSKVSKNNVKSEAEKNSRKRVTIRETEQRSAEYNTHVVNSLKTALKKLSDTVFLELDTLESSIDKNNRHIYNRINALEDKVQDQESLKRRISKLESRYFAENPTYSPEPEVTHSLLEERVKLIETDISMMRQDIVECSSAENLKKIYAEIDEVKKTSKMYQKPQNEEKVKTLVTTVGTMSEKITKISKNFREIEAKISNFDEKSEKNSKNYEEILSKMEEIQAKFTDEIDRLKLKIIEENENLTLKVDILTKK